jgi:hypothetical protein
MQLDSVLPWVQLMVSPFVGGEVIHNTQVTAGLRRIYAVGPGKEIKK